MTRWLLRCFLFSIPILGGLGFVEWKLREVPNVYSTKRVLLEARLADTEVLFLGSSHEANGIAADLLAVPAFNAANLSQSLYYDHAILTRYLPRMPRVRLVVLAVSHFSLWYELDEFASASFAAYQYRWFWDIGLRSWREWLDARAFSLIAVYGPRTVQRLVKNGFEVEAPTRFTASGWDPLPGIRAASASAADRAVSEVEAVMTSRHHRSNLERVRSMLATCRERGVGVALVTLPVSGHYAARMDRAKWAWSSGVTRALAAQFGAEYRDYTDDRRFTDADFWDAEHLSPVGAQRFTLVLERELVSPALAAARGPPLTTRRVVDRDASGTIGR